MLQNKILLISAVSLIFIVTLSLSSKFRDIGPTSYEDVLCHYFYYENDEKDVLEKITDTFNPIEKSIFFLETSCKGKLNSRQLCSIEAASRYHPDGHIYVLFAGPLKKNQFLSGGMKILKSFRNVKLRRINIMEFVQNTPLKDMVMRGALVKGRWRVTKTSSILRLLTLYKFGGVYLDMDMLVAKSLWPLGNNWIGKDDDELSTAAMSFSTDEVGRKFMNDVADYMKDNYDDELEVPHYEVEAMTNVLPKLCSTGNVEDMSEKTCKGISVLATQEFYAIPIEEADAYFDPGDIQYPNAYGYHFWNTVTHRFPVLEDTRYAQLAKKHCPTTYEKYDDTYFFA